MLDEEHGFNMGSGDYSFDIDVVFNPLIPDGGWVDFLVVFMKMSL